jgi:hypothetical protein
MAFAVGLLALGTIGANADIGLTFQGRGGYLPGGDFTNGPWPAAGAYYQVLWSMDDPAGALVQPGGLASNEVLLYDNNTVKPYGYWDPTPLIVVRESSVPNVNTSGYVYTRLFEDDTTDAGTAYYQSPGVANSSLPVYDAQNPSTIAALLTPSGAALGQNGMVVVPEPGTGLLLALSGLVLAIRRRMTS